MGGNLALTAASAFPGRFAVVASFHGGSLVTDEPDSLHRFVKHITAYVYVASAVEDAYFTEDQKICLEEALTEAAHLVETIRAHIMASRSRIYHLRFSGVRSSLGKPVQTLA
jgi:dienelactone hydrolase